MQTKMSGAETTEERRFHSFVGKRHVTDSRAVLYSYIHTQRVTLRVSKKATREFSFDMLAVLSKVKTLPEEGFE